MRITTMFLALACLSLTACETPAQLSCQARLEQVRNEQGLSDTERAAKRERQVQICRAEQGDQAAKQWLANNR